MDPKTTTGNEVRRGSALTPHVGTYVSSLQHFDVSSDLTIDRLVGGGGFSDVYRAQLHIRAKQFSFLMSHNCIRSGCKTVAVKRFRVFLSSDENIRAVRNYPLRLGEVLSYSVVDRKGSTDLVGLEASECSSTSWIRYH